MMVVADIIPSETDIRGLLDEIVDPCSRAAGAPAGISEMGMIPRIDIVDRGDGRIDVDVKLLVTHPFCMMSSIFINEIDQKLRAVDSIATVHVNLDTADMWTPERMSEDYRARLDAQRARRRDNQRRKEMAS
jgi:metal-sulfur cluster biosynthetic enzyme